MTIGFGELAWVLGSPMLLGLFALRAVGIRPSDDRIACLGWAWMLGCLALGLLLFGWLHLGVPAWLWWTAVPFGAIAIGLLAAQPRLRPMRARLAPPPFDPWFTGFVVVGLAWCVLQVGAGMSWPCIEGDEGNIWSLKAKSLLLDPLSSGFAEAQRHNLHPDYPMLNPFLQAWVNAGRDQLLHFENRLLVQCCGIALFLALAGALRSRLPGWLAGLLSLVVLLEPEFTGQCRLAYADGMVALGMLVAWDAWLRGREQGRLAWRWLAAAGLAFGLWSKNESLMYAAASFGGLLLGALIHPPAARGLHLRSIACLSLPALVVVLQAWFNRMHGLQNDLLGANPSGRTLTELVVTQFDERAPVVAARGAEMVFSLHASHGVFALLLLAPLALPLRCFSRELAGLTFMLLASLVGVHLVYVGSFLDLDFHLGTSHARVLFQLVPLAMLWFACLARGLLGTATAGAQTVTTHRPDAPPEPRRDAEAPAT
ncbi:MAG: hypothetical protein RIT25_2132 [Planctomycetota bacterium]